LLCREYCIASIDFLRTKFICDVRSRLVRCSTRSPREPDERRRFTVLVSLQGRRSWYLRLMEAGRNSRPRRDGFSPLSPSPPLSLKHSILIQHLPGVRWWRWRVCACVHAAPAAELIIKRLRGISVKTARHDVVDGVAHVATNVRGITSLTMACVHRKLRSLPCRGES